MKIQCEQCKIEYNIDDASIGDRGIRAQCPRCNHITTIRKSQSAILDQARAKLDMAICVNCGKPTEPNPNDPIPICASCQAMTSNTGEFGQRTTISPAQLPAPSRGRGGGGGGGAGMGMSGGNGGVSPVSSPSLPPPAPAYVPPGMDGALPNTAALQWRIKKSPGGEIYGPFDRDLVTGWIETDKILPADEISRVGGPWRSAGEHEDFLPVFAKRYGGSLEKKDTLGLEDRNTGSRNTGNMMMRPGNSIVRGGGGGGAAVRTPIPLGLIAGIAGAIVLVGVVLGLWVQGMIPSGIGVSATPTPVADATDKRLDAIREEFPGVTGSAAEHLAAGEAALLPDTVDGYQTARKEFLQTLAIDRGDLKAMALLAETDALLARYDQQTSLLPEALAFSDRAVNRFADNPVSHRAKAAYFLAAGQANASEARTLLETQVLSKVPEDPLAATMLGMSLRGIDDARAEQLFKKAIESGPQLIRPRVELGMLYEAGRRYQKALATFKPVADRSFLASYRTGVIDAEVGNYGAAAAAYRSAARASENSGGRPFVDATIAAAVIEYQALGNVREAAGLLVPLEKRFLSEAAPEKLRPDQASLLRLHLAVVARLSGQLDRSLSLSTRVIQDNEFSLAPAAHFNSALVRLRKADFDGADKDFEEADASSLGHREKSEVYFWHGQLRARRGDVPGAGSRFEDAVREDPNNWRAVVGNGLLLAETERQIEALDKLQELAHNDPEFYDQYQIVTLFPPDPTRELLEKATAAFTKVYRAQETDPRAASALGILAFLSDKKPAAERYFASALSEQNPDAAAYIFSGLIAEGRGGKADIAKALDRYTSVKTTAPSPFLSMALGRAELKRGNYEKAISELQDALNRSPDYTPAHFWLGECYRRQGEKRQAMAKWADALKYDPHYLRASRAILEQDT